MKWSLNFDYSFAWLDIQINRSSKITNFNRFLRLYVKTQLQKSNEQYFMNCRYWGNSLRILTNPQQFLFQCLSIKLLCKILILLFERYKRVVQNRSIRLIYLNPIILILQSKQASDSVRENLLIYYIVKDKRRKYLLILSSILYILDKVCILQEVCNV